MLLRTNTVHTIYMVILYKNDILAESDISGSTDKGGGAVYIITLILVRPFRTGAASLDITAPPTILYPAKTHRAQTAAQIKINKPTPFPFPFPFFLFF